MTRALEKQLVEKYPKFFEYLIDYKGPIMPMVFGFECYDGWFVLIDTLMLCIQDYINDNNPNMVINLTQVKEKFGGLRFYYDGGDDYIDGMVHLTEQMSYRTCEFCGTTHNIGQTSGWIITTCKKCFDAGKTNLSEWQSLEDIEKQNRINKDL